MNWPTWLPMAFITSKQVLVRLQDRAAEELHDAEHSAVHDDGEGERSVEPFGRGNGRPMEVVSLGHVGNPLGHSRRPDAAGKTDSALERMLPRRGLESRDMAADDT